MAENKMFYPKAYPIRQPTDNKKKHGDIVNPPRMAQLGGLSSTGKVSGLKNDMRLRKPNDTK